MRLTLSMASYGRPQRTIRAINSIANQTINNWEALVIGDGCPVMQDFIDSDYFQDVIKMCSFYGNDLIIENNPVNQGGNGFAVINNNIKIAQGKYFVFFANDDVIDVNHFRNYLEIENTDLDYMFFDSFIDPIGKARESRLAPSVIGHSEIILKTELAKKLPEHSAKYGHDWEFINAMSEKGKGEKSKSQTLSYRVMHVPNLGTKDKID
jgi:GT2 family glycosyltransferase